MAHGCQAGLQQKACEEIYRHRILRENEFYSTKKLGAFASDLGALASFFETPWSRVMPTLKETDQAWLFSVAAFNLRALGRLTETLEPMRAGLQMYLKQEHWLAASIVNNNLSELELMLGKVADAISNAEQSVTNAERSGKAFQKIVSRITHADALHQSGRTAEAEMRFCEAEQMQTESEPESPVLYSLQGFRFCELLLAVPECAAWQFFNQQEHGQSGDKSSHIKAVRAVYQRAVRTLKWAEDGNMSLLSIALDHLTVGRASFYEALLVSSGGPLRIQDSTLRTALDDAVNRLRRAGTTHHLPRGLLTRAWLRFLGGARTGPESAQEDLDEAWEIAERGPMRLHMADIHLYRARLFFREAKYPWENPQYGS